MGKKEHRTNYSWVNFTGSYPKPDSDGAAEYRAQLDRERAAAAAEAQTQRETEAAAWSRHVHEVRVEAGRKGAARRWAGHKKARAGSREQSGDPWDWLKILGGLVFIGWRIFDKIRGRKK